MKSTVILLAGLAFVSRVLADTDGTDLQAFQGRWLVDRLEENGVPVAAEELKKFTITIKGTQMVVSIDGHDDTIDFKIDASKSPKNIDTTSNFGEDKGKTAHGIYELNATTLSICACFKGERPKKIASESGVMLMVLKRP
jgi:uncharacterized protein (TIGR03067 family)